MSGRRQVTDRGPRAATGPSVAHQAELDEQSLLGNEMLAARLHGGPPDDDDVRGGARDAAAGLVERAGLALLLEPLHPAVLARFRGILDASGLDPATRTGVAGRLEADAAAARQVSEAVQSCFGRDDPGLRDELAGALDAVAAAIARAEPVGGGWRLRPEGGPVAAEHDPDALVIAAAEALGPTRGEPSAILAFCHRVWLALPDDDEEDAPPEPGDDPA